MRKTTISNLGMSVTFIFLSLLSSRMAAASRESSNTSFLMIKRLSDELELKIQEMSKVPRELEKSLQSIMENMETRIMSKIDKRFEEFEKITGCLNRQNLKTETEGNSTSRDNFSSAFLINSLESMETKIISKLDKHFEDLVGNLSTTILQNLYPQTVQNLASVRPEITYAYQGNNDGRQYVPNCQLTQPSFKSNPLLSEIYQQPNLLKCVTTLIHVLEIRTALNYWNDIYCLDSATKGTQDLQTLKPHLLPRLQQIIRDFVALTQLQLEVSYSNIANFIKAVNITEGYDFLVKVMSQGIDLPSKDYKLFEIGSVILGDIGSNSSAFRRLPSFVQKILSRPNETWLISNSETGHFLTFEDEAEQGSNIAVADRDSGVPIARWKILIQRREDLSIAPGGVNILNPFKLQGERCTDLICGEKIKWFVDLGLENELSIFVESDDTFLVLYKTYRGSVCLGETPEKRLEHVDFVLREGNLNATGCAKWIVTEN